MTMFAVTVAMPRTQAWTPHVQRLIELEKTAEGFRYLIGVAEADAFERTLREDEVVLHYEILGELFVDAPIATNVASAEAISF